MDGFYNDQDLKDAADLIEACLTWVPKDRISAKNANNTKLNPLKVKRKTASTADQKKAKTRPMFNLGSQKNNSMKYIT